MRLLSMQCPPKMASRRAPTRRKCRLGRHDSRLQASRARPTGSTYCCTTSAQTPHPAAAAAIVASPATAWAATRTTANVPSRRFRRSRATCCVPKALTIEVPAKARVSQPTLSIP